MCIYAHAKLIEEFMTDRMKKVRSDVKFLQLDLVEITGDFEAFLFCSTIKISKYSPVAKPINFIRNPVTVINSYDLI